MGLHELTLRDFRLFGELTLAPDPNAVTVFLSKNGTGKTSVLEAVHALATAASFRTASASDLIRHDRDVAEVHGLIYQGERRVQVDLTLTRGARATTKRMLVNGQRPRSRADLSAVLPLTVFTPEGVDIVRGGPEQRRSFLTTLSSDVDLTTGEIIERFTRILTQRNALLRALEGVRPTQSQRDELQLWTKDFVDASDELLEVREHVIEELAPLTREYYQRLAGTSSEVDVRYERSWRGSLVEALERSFDDERYRGYTNVGPHRDDVMVALDGREARRQASQGEQRSLALAMRLAGHDLVRRHRGVEALLLLDDVFSELDPLRAHRLLELLPAGQTLVTTAAPLPEGMAPAATIDLETLVA